MSRRFLIGLILVDAPALVAVAVAGSLYGYAHTYEAVASWRLAHPWSFAPSIILAGAIAYRWRRRARGSGAELGLKLGKVPR